MNYTYYCNTCKNKKDINHSMNESPIIICEKCNDNMKIEIGKPCIIFKGNGFTKERLV